MNQVPASGVPDGVYLLDVRENDEWTAGHAPDAVHIRLGELGVKADEVPKDQPVYIICRSGARSGRAAQALGANGWDVTNVSDGMQGWESAGRAMVSESGAPPFVA